ncbi:MAG: hypothetical protein IPL71_10710 [Anaerolineales bacterium]|uniref:hypothetical protein n=1 Tax=Candidatus Villigracilis proximus TaxID=3140683 RepID=UPI0031349501|nr:hypothetical protein [Anaerolineales bacterium]
MLVSKGNLFLEQLLASLPGIQPFRALPADDGTLQIPNDPFDLYVFDGYVPAELPKSNLLLINPPTILFEVGDVFKEMGEFQVNEHALTQFVDWKTVHVLQAHKVTLPNWMSVLIETDDNPLVFAGETNGQRIAALSFDLRESDLPLQIAYPILSPTSSITSRRPAHLTRHNLCKLVKAFPRPANGCKTSDRFFAFRHNLFRAARAKPVQQHR